MSRIDKRLHQDNVQGTARDTSVRLFAFANTRPIYNVVFAPEHPICVLKTKSNPVTPAPAAAPKSTGTSGDSKAQPQQHPCLQWKPLADMVFQMQPNTTHALYLADTTPLTTASPQYEQEEMQNMAVVGPLLKQLGNVIAKLNPHDGTLVAAGVSAYLGFKFALLGEKHLGHPDRYFRRLLLVCPPAPAAFERLAAALQRARNTSWSQAELAYPAPEVVVIVKTLAEGAPWQQLLSSLQDAGLLSGFAVSCDVTPSLFAAVAREAGIEADGTVVDTNQRYAAPRVYRIDFVFSKQTKGVEQFPRPSPLDTAGWEEGPEGPQEGEEEGAHDEDDEHHHHHEGEGDEEEWEEDDEGEDAHAHAHAHGGDAHGHSHGGVPCSGHHHADPTAQPDENTATDGAVLLLPGITALQVAKEPARVLIEGRLLDLAAGLVGTTEGCVRVTGLETCLPAAAPPPPAAMAGARKKAATPLPPAITFAASIRRNALGCTSLHAVEARYMNKKEEKQSFSVGASLAELPLSYNTSAIAYHYGALLIRGRKCALVRELPDEEGGAAGEEDALFIPHVPHQEAGETALDCAVRALCEACDVSSENFYLPSYLAPVVYYLPLTAAEQQEMKEVLQETGETDVAPPSIICVTIYTALAVCPPPRGAASDLLEDDLEPSEPYDFVGFERAQALLQHAPEEVRVVRTVEQQLRDAHRVGLFTPVKGCGVFGDRITPHASSVAATAAAAAAGPTTTTTTTTTTTSTTQPATLLPVAQTAASGARSQAVVPTGDCSLEGLNVFVLILPGYNQEDHAITISYERLQSTVLLLSLCNMAGECGDALLWFSTTKANSSVVTARSMAELQSAARDAHQQHKSLVIVWNNWLLHTNNNFSCATSGEMEEENDIYNFCHRYILPLTEETGAQVQFLTFVYQHVVAQLFGGDAEAAFSASVSSSTVLPHLEKKEMVWDLLSRAVNLSDALFYVPTEEATQQLPPGLRGPAGTVTNASRDTARQQMDALLQWARLLSEDIAFFSYRLPSYAVAPVPEVQPPQPLLLDRAHPLALEPSLPVAPPMWSFLRLQEARVPVAAASLAYYTQPGTLALTPLYQDNAAMLLLVEGSLWVSTRPDYAVAVSLNMRDRCLAVEAGEPWEEAGEGRRSTLRLLVWLAPGGADHERAAQVEQEVRQTAAQLFTQLLYSPERDGDDVGALLDPLPAWDDAEGEADMA